MTAPQESSMPESARAGSSPLAWIFCGDCKAGGVASSFSCCDISELGLLSGSFYRDQGCTVTDASLVTIGIGRCCESLALICTMDRLDVPGASALITMPIMVPVPLTPGVFG